MTIFADTETFSPTPIKHGTYKYASDAEVMLFPYAIDDGPIKCWDRTATKQMPSDLHYALYHLDDELVFHNAMFDRNALRLGDMKLDIPIERWRCSMVRALSHALPGSLDKLCSIFGLTEEEAKHKSGRRLIHLFCKPLPKNQTLRRATRATHPKEWQEFIDYAKADVAAMRTIWGRLPAWNYQGRELALWHRDQRANDRGFAVDVDLARAAIRTVERTQKRLAGKVHDLTDGAVASATKRDAMLAYILEEHGIALPDMQMATLERRINDHSLPVELRELLAIRLQATTTSTSKYTSLINGEVKGRLHGTMQFNGAGRTRRVAHRLFQPGNMPRPNMSNDEIELGIDAIKHGYVESVHSNVMNTLANAIRGCIIAGPGKKLVVSDLKNIEGVSATWIAGEAWKLQAFREYYAGIGADLYKIAYGRAFATSPDFDAKTPEGYLKRQIGKVMELMLQYGGGVGAFITGAATYGIDLDLMAEAAFPTIPADVWAEAEQFYEWTVKQKRNTFGLTKKVFCVCDALKRLWRRAHPAIASLWPELEDVIRKAIENPGVTYTCRVLKVRRDGAWLRIVLPSGNALCYPFPQVSDKGTISYMGINQYTHQWARINSYGGKFFENVCQGFARDVMYHGIELAEDDGFEYVLSIHDEPTTETPDEIEFTADRLSAHLATVPSWAPGLPLAADGYEGYRFHKE